MSLSVGTLNLKFMQRGAAKSGAAIPEAVPRGVLAAEQEARWVLPRRTGANASASTSEKKPGIDASVYGSAPAGPSRAGGVGGVRVSYESSYVPFITETGGGGRMRFGGFGQAEEQPEGEGEGEGDDDGEDAEAEEGEAKVRRQVAVRRPPATTASSSRNSRRSPSPASSSRQVTSKGFLRPSNYSPPPASSSAGASGASGARSDGSFKKGRRQDNGPSEGQVGAGAGAGVANKLSTAGRLRQTISGMRSGSGASASASASANPGAGAGVKLEAEAAAGDKKPARALSGSPAGMGDASQSKDKGKGKGKGKNKGKGNGTGMDEIEAKEDRDDGVNARKRGLEVGIVPPTEVKRLKTEFKPNTASQRSSQNSSPHPGLPSSGTGGTSGTATPDIGLEREGRENGGIVDLDAREREIRAQKKREKKARRKARKEGEGEGEA